MSALEPKSATKEIYQLIARDLDLYVPEIAEAMVQLVYEHINKVVHSTEVKMSYDRVVKSLKKSLECFADVEDLCPNCLSDNLSYKTERQLIGECWGAPAYDDVPVGAKCEDCEEEWSL